MTGRDFHLGDILSVTTEHLVSPRHMNGVYDVLGYMTGDSLFSHQLPRAAAACAPALLAQHPQLADVTVPEDFGGEQGVRTWLADQVDVYGERLDVTPLSAWQHQNPMEELADRIGPDRVAVLDPSRPESLDEVIGLLRRTGGAA